MYTSGRCCDGRHDAWPLLLFPPGFSEFPEESLIIAIPGTDQNLENATNRQAVNYSSFSRSYRQAGGGGSVVIGSRALRLVVCKTSGRPLVLRTADPTPGRALRIQHSGFPLMYHDCHSHPPSPSQCSSLLLSFLLWGTDLPFTCPILTTITANHVETRT